MFISYMDMWLYVRICYNSQFTQGAHTLSEYGIYENVISGQTSLSLFD